MLNLAASIAEKSQDPRTRCGAVIAYGDQVLGTGYNHLPERTRQDMWSQKHVRTIHAELAAIIDTGLTDLTGCTIYLSTRPNRYLTCARCAAILIAMNIGRVVVQGPIDIAPHWSEEFRIAMQLYREAYVPVEIVDE